MGGFGVFASPIRAFFFFFFLKFSVLDFTSISIKELTSKKKTKNTTRLFVAGEQVRDAKQKKGEAYGKFQVKYEKEQV